MKLICPSCGAIHSAESWLSDANARQCLKIVAELPWEVSRRSLHYIALFRPRSGRGLQWGKALRLLGEVADLVKTNFVQWDSQPARPCTSGTWGQAMEKMIGFPPKRLPLKSHGYLKSVAYEIADDLDRHREKKVIKAEQSGNISKIKAEGTEAEGRRVSVEEIRKFKKKLRGGKA